MYRPRIIPVLSLSNNALVKTIKFKDEIYIGDPINAVKIFNDLKADELVFLDINASKNKSSISLEFIKKIAEEAFMPFAVGGGINDLNLAKDLINNGAEKVVINTSLSKKPKLIIDIVKMFGSQSVIGSIDIKENIFGKNYAYIYGGTKKVKQELRDYILFVEDLGVGEILINTIKNDGLMIGYNTDIIEFVNSITTVPIIACGGANNLNDMANIISHGAHAAAAGSLFLFHSRTKGILINYPTDEELYELFSQ